MIKHVYISGRGHSGSTILDLLLGYSNGIRNTGELISGLDRWNGQICSCKDILPECEFWSLVYKNITSRRDKSFWENLRYRLVRQAHVRSFVWSLFVHRNDAYRCKLVNYNFELTDTILRIKKDKVLLESSKEITRALFLLKHKDDVGVVHLVRNPFDVIKSHYKRIQMDGSFQILRKKFKLNKYSFTPFLVINTIVWSVNTSIAVVLRHIYKSRFTLLRFEDLKKNPVSVISDLSLKFDLNLYDSINACEKGLPLKIDHVMAGNKLRFTNSVTFGKIPSSKLELPWYYQVIIFIFCFPGLLIFKYF